MLKKTFYESLLELNEIDSYRDKEYGDILHDAVMNYDKSNMNDIMKKNFLTSLIPELFNNTYKLINYFEDAKLHKKLFIFLSYEPKKALHTIINDLEKELFKQKSKGNYDNDDILLEIDIHQRFLNSPSEVKKMFDKINIYLTINNDLVSNLKYTAKDVDAQKRKDFILKSLKIQKISQFYNGYGFIGKNFKDNLWHSTTIKIFKLCQILNNSKIKDNKLLEKINDLFLTQKLQLSLKTTRLNKAYLYTFVNNTPIWIYRGQKESIEDIDIYDTYLKSEFTEKVEQKENETNLYAKIFKNTPNSLFLVS